MYHFIKITTKFFLRNKKNFSQVVTRIKQRYNTKKQAKVNQKNNTPQNNQNRNNNYYKNNYTYFRIIHIFRFSLKFI